MIDHSFADIDLQRDIVAELSWDPSVPAGQIGVTVKDGVVTLSGHTTSFFGKHAAETAASRVRGVQAIVEHVEVVLNGTTKFHDEDIAAAASLRLGSDGTIPQGAIVPRVEEGWITLRGKVDWHFERDAAERNVRPIAGVVGVVNMITVKPRVDVLDVRESIRNALHRSAFLDRDTVMVAVDGGTVRLTGSVASIHERDVAEQTALQAAGSVSVVNMLTIA
jgi:osmotically-inducible protein OsmY